MSFTVTAGGVQKLFSLSGDEDRVPITAQVIEVHCQATRKEITLSDGVHFCCVTLAKRLHHLMAMSELQRGGFVTLNNYISQPVDDDKLVVICLDASVVGFSESLVGEPSEFVPISQTSNFTNDFVANANANDEHCKLCNEEPCDWNVYKKAGR
jgi:hypothetical protein